MTGLTTVTDKPDVQRDHWGRPLIVPPGGGKPVPYSRASSFDVLEDMYNLQRWQQRMVALGLADRPDLVLAAAAHRDDKAELNKICEKAREAAAASSGATTGTALHAFTEQVDRGEDPVIPASIKADIDAYRRATADLEMVDIEVFGVCDEVRAAGTWDRIVRWKGGLFVADLKTGNVEYGQGKMSQQLAIYAHCDAYDIDTAVRTPTGVYRNAGIIIHLPAGEGRCTLHWIDLKAGWEAVQQSAWVREWRKRKDLMQEWK